MELFSPIFLGQDIDIDIDIDVDVDVDIDIHIDIHIDINIHIHIHINIDIDIDAQGNKAITNYFNLQSANSFRSHIFFSSVASINECKISIN